MCRQSAADNGRQVRQLQFSCHPRPNEQSGYFARSSILDCATKQKLKLLDSASGERARVRFPTGVIDYSLLRSVQTTYWARTGFFFGRGKAAGAWSTIRLHLVPRLRMSGAVPTLLPCLHGLHRHFSTGYMYSCSHLCARHGRMKRGHGGHQTR